MSVTAWLSGRPTRVGWYDASTSRKAGERRYWNGAGWSACVQVGQSDAEARRACSTLDESVDGIEWRGLLIDSMSETALEAYADALRRDVDMREDESAAAGPVTVPRLRASIERTKQMSVLIGIRKQRLMDRFA